MTISQEIIIIAIVIVGTMLTRFLPFLIFTPEKEIPAFVQYLGKVLPPASFGLLVVYALREVELFGGSHGLPELISILLIIGLHYLFRSMLLSIAGGTILYMLLVQFVF